MCNIGLGLRREHYSFLDEKAKIKVKWFEVITENHINSKGKPWEILTKVRKDFPVSFHGVSLSIGSAAPLNTQYLQKLKAMIEVFDPFIISDHLCFTGLPNANTHNLLPLPFTESVLDHLEERIDKVQNFLGRKITLENLSAYFNFAHSEFNEWDFIQKLLRQTDCMMLLDINNVYVNSKNHNFDPHVYLDAIPKDKIAEIHLAGFSDMGNFLFDTHSNPVFPEVWDLFSYTIKDLKDVPVLIEWDENIPDYLTLEAEALKAKSLWEKHYA